MTKGITQYKYRGTLKADMTRDKYPLLYERFASQKKHRHFKYEMKDLCKIYNKSEAYLYSMKGIMFTTNMEFFDLNLLANLKNASCSREVIIKTLTEGKDIEIGVRTLNQIIIKHLDWRNVFLKNDPKAEELKKLHRDFYKYFNDRKSQVYLWIRTQPNQNEHFSVYYNRYRKMFFRYYFKRKEK